MYEYKTKGTCSQMIYFDLEDGKVKNVQFLGGCNGNLKGIGQLVEGMNVDDVIAPLEGTPCGMKKTSCPHQLAQALGERAAYRTEREQQNGGGEHPLGAIAVGCPAADRHEYGHRQQVAGDDDVGVDHTRAQRLRHHRQGCGHYRCVVHLHEERTTDNERDHAHGAPFTIGKLRGRRRNGRVGWRLCHARRQVK